MLMRVNAPKLHSIERFDRDPAGLQEVSRCKATVVETPVGRAPSADDSQIPQSFDHAGTHRANHCNLWPNPENLASPYCQRCQPEYGNTVLAQIGWQVTFSRKKLSAAIWVIANFPWSIRGGACNQYQPPSKDAKRRQECQRIARSSPKFGRQR